MKFYFAVLILLVLFLSVYSFELRIATLFRPLSHKKFDIVYANSQLLFFIKSLRALINIKINVCVFGQSNYFSLDPSIVSNNFIHVFDYVESPEKFISIDHWWSLLCLSKVSEKYADAGHTDNIIGFFSPSVMITNASFIKNIEYSISSINANSSVACYVGGKSYGLPCDFRVVFVHSILGYVLQNMLINIIHFNVSSSFSSIFADFINLFSANGVRIPDESFSGHDPQALLLEEIFTNYELNPNILSCAPTSTYMYNCSSTISNELLPFNSTTASPTDDTSYICSCRWSDVTVQYLSDHPQVEVYLHNYLNSNRNLCKIFYSTINYDNIDGCDNNSNNNNNVNNSITFSSPITTTTTTTSTTITINQNKEYHPQINKTKKPTKVFDVFPFFDEINLLRLRYELLKDVIDTFILIESPHTHTGLEKPLHFQNNQHLFPQKLLDRTIHVIIKLPYVPIKDPDDAWENERFQRNAFIYMIHQKVITLEHEDIIFHSDVDEIFHPKAVLDITRILSLGQPASQHIIHTAMSFYYYNLSCQMEMKPWLHGYAFQYGHIYHTYFNSSYWESLMSYLRLEIVVYPTVNIYHNGGWHLSYFKNFQRITSKLEAFAHMEVNTNTIKKSIVERAKQGLSIVHLNESDSYCRLPSDQEKNSKVFQRLNYLWDTLASEEDKLQL